MLRLLKTESCGIHRPKYIRDSTSSSFSISVHLSSKNTRESSFNNDADVASPLPPDELAKTILKRQYFVDDRTSHRPYFLTPEMKNRIAFLNTRQKNFSYDMSNFDANNHKSA